MPRLQDRIMTITGAGSGLGREVALVAAAEGATIVVTDKVEARTGPVVDLTVGAGGTASGLRLPLDQTRRTGDAAHRRQRHRRDVVVGRLRGVSRLRQIWRRQGRRQRARASAAYDFGHYGIRTNAVCPTHGMSANFALGAENEVLGKSFEQVRGPWIPENAVMPLKLPTPPTLRDNAWPVIFLASDESPYMSGNGFPTTDGGQHARVSIPFPDRWRLEDEFEVV